MLVVIMSDRETGVVACHLHAEPCEMERIALILKWLGAVGHLVMDHRDNEIPFTSQPRCCPQ